MMVLFQELRNLLNCAKAGANAAKFQHFKAETIVSEFSFNNMKKVCTSIKLEI